MNKFLKKLLLALSSVLCIASFAACGDKNEPAPKPQPEVKYVVKYAAGGGTGTAPAQKEYEPGTEITVAENPFTYEGHIFDFWQFGSQRYMPGDSYVVNGDTEFTAVWKTEQLPPEPVDISTLTYGDARIQLLSPTLVRIEQRGPKGFEDRTSYYVMNRVNWQEVEYEEKTVNDETVVETKFYTVHIPENGTAEEIYITAPDGSPLYNYRGNVGANVYLPSPSDELDCWYFTDSPRVIPSENGYSADKDGAPLQGWDLDNDATDIFVFLPNGSYSRFCKDYVDLTGPSEMVTLGALGYWDSRWYADSAESALKRITDYKDRGYAIDVVVIDVDYKDPIKNGQWGVGYEINETLFPDMAKFLDDCHKLGVSVMFNDHPIPVTGTGNLLDTAEVEYRKQNLTCFLALGVDYWWYDRNWDACLNPIDPDISVYATGMYAFQFITRDYYESITDVGEYAKRALIMGNVDGLVNGKWMYASDVSAHRYSIQWTGDINSGSDALAFEIYNAVYGGAEVGIPYMSSDMGGFKSAVSNDQYIRWVQYCALSTVMRAHVDTGGSGQSGRMPWLFGETAEEVAHTYQDMRYRLLPLYYTLAYRNYSEGLPILARTDIAYPEYAEASANDQYMLGDHILVAPIAEAGLKKVPDNYFTHNENGQTVPGLTCEYYGNKDLSGTPLYTGTADNIFFDWGLGAPVGLPNDNFSIRFKGNVTFDKSAALQVFADDSVKVYIDGKLAVDGSAVYDKYLETAEYAAGSTHEIEVQYAEFGANAHIFMYINEKTAIEDIENTRNVFIPDGTWIDVWSGKRYVGPYTYTVTHNIKTSPLFVREGALVVLADNAENTQSGLWDKLTLDVYPSAENTANTVLYEDDTKTVAYKSGKYRTTAIGMTQTGNKTSLVIKSAVGSFDGERAFTERTWNVRLHKNPDWGNITSVKVNGKNIAYKQVSRSASAKPFAYSGAALDGDVYELSFDAAVYSDTNIEIEWSAVGGVHTKSEYDKTAVDFGLSCGPAGDGAKLDDCTEDWVSYGTAHTESEYISYPVSYDVPRITGGQFFCSEYSENDRNTYDFSALTSNINFDWTVKTLGRDAYYVFYLGGEYCTANLTVRDRAGNVETVTFGNMDGAFTQRAVIRVKGDAQSVLYVKYSVNSGIPVGTGTKSQVSAIAAFVSETLPEITESENNVTVTGNEISDTSGKVDLTAMGETGDWIRFEQRGHVRKSGGSTFLGASFTEESVLTDYPAEISYSDGTLDYDESAKRQGRFSILGDTTLTLKVTPENKHIILYAGAWKATCTAKVYTTGGKLLGSSESVVWESGSALCKRITLDIDVEKECVVIVKLVCSDADTASRGNVSLAAAVVAAEIAEPEEPSVSLNCKVVSYSEPETVDLTSVGTKDWSHFHSGDTKKSGGNYIDNSSLYCDQDNNMPDYRLSLGWSDGTKTETTSGNRNGIFGNNISIRIKVDASVKKIRIWTGGWESDLNVKATAEDGTMLVDTNFATRTAGYSNANLLEFDVTAEKEEYITVTLKNITTSGGNVVLIAAAVA